MTTRKHLPDTTPSFSRRTSLPGTIPKKDKSNVLAGLSPTCAVDGGPKGNKVPDQRRDKTPPGNVFDIDSDQEYAFKQRSDVTSHQQPQPNPPFESKRSLFVSTFPSSPDINLHADYASESYDHDCASLYFPQPNYQLIYTDCSGIDPDMSGTLDGSSYAINFSSNSDPWDSNTQIDRDGTKIYDRSTINPFSMGRATIMKTIEEFGSVRKRNNTTSAAERLDVSAESRIPTPQNPGTPHEHDTSRYRSPYIDRNQNLEQQPTFISYAAEHHNGPITYHSELSDQATVAFPAREQMQDSYLLSRMTQPPVAPLSQLLSLPPAQIQTQFQTESDSLTQQSSLASSCSSLSSSSPSTTYLLNPQLISDSTYQATYDMVQSASNYQEKCDLPPSAERGLMPMIECPDKELQTSICPRQGLISQPSSGEDEVYSCSGDDNETIYESIAPENVPA